ncbi:hypothetical protein AB3G45_10665 [Shinella sp. S4-D37]|uniref:hypothetical protein n=1 Tax=Shinella sp. S4-D37 TaxID=3161999 RepID=UPI003466F716
MNLTPPEHEHTAAIDEAARWLATSSPSERSGPVIPDLRQRFGLTALQATEACREATLIRARAT